MGRPASDIRARIVEAARARFLALGVEGASLREIARDAGTNLGMIVYYFPSKDDLFLAVVEEVYAGVVEDMAAILAPDGRPARERLRAAFLRLGRASDREVEVIQLIIREGISSSTRLRRIVARFMRGHVALLLDTVSDAVDKSEFDRTLPIPLILLALMGLGGLPQVVRRAGGAIPLFAALPSSERLADLSIELLFRALGPRPSETSLKPPRRRGSR